MTDSEKRARLNEIGKEIAKMYPERIGSLTFDIVLGKLTGVRESNGWRIKGRPSPSIAGGY
jgi:hypothetical protein